MAATIPFTPLLSFFFLFLSSYILQSSSQLTPQNIQVFYPFPLPPPPILPPPPPSPPPPTPPPPPPTNTPIPTTTTPSKLSNKTVPTAIAATAASTFVLSAVFFLLLVRYKRYRKEKEPPRLQGGDGNRNPVLLMNDQFTRLEGIKGVIVDEEGLDVLYWKNLDGGGDGYDKKSVFKKEEEEKKMMGVDNGGRKSKKSDARVQEVPLLRGKSSSSHVWPPGDENKSQSNSLSVENQDILIKSQLSSRSPPPTPPSPPPAPPPPPPPLPPAVVVGRKGQAPPPPLPPRTNGVALPSRAEPPAQVKLKPLHWDKVDTKMGHPMAWDKLENGSFRFDGDLMEALFGTVAKTKQSPRPTSSPSPKPDPKPGLPSQVLLLDARKSQNISIILRSLVVSRQEIIDCLLEGKGLDTDTLEKLTRIRPTKPEERLILNYDGDITKLADAESFLYHVLRSVPSAFNRFNAMFFKLTHTSEVTQIKNTLQTLETACTELRTRGLFVKLLEAILKAGNRMNAGTSRGNAQAFDMNSLLKLSDVKSSDGSTSLLHFVVEEVVRLEGKRCMINRNHSLRNSAVNLNSDTDRGKDYIMLGLPVVGGVSSEFSNVKKAAGVDYDALLSSCSGLTSRLDEITRSVEDCRDDNDGGRGFVKEIEKFIDSAKKETRALREEEMRVMELVKKTNEYYRVGSSKDKPRKQFQLFVIVKTFLEMVDKACIDIAIKLQKRRASGEQVPVTVPGMPTSPNRPSVRFPVLPANFISSSSSDSDEDT